VRGASSCLFSYSGFLAFKLSLCNAGCSFLQRSDDFGHFHHRVHYAFGFGFVGLAEQLAPRDYPMKYQLLYGLLLSAATVFDFSPR